jgi:hypothetical protein
LNWTELFVHTSRYRTTKSNHFTKYITSNYNTVVTHFNSVIILSVQTASSTAARINGRVYEYISNASRTVQNYLYQLIVTPLISQTLTTLLPYRVSIRRQNTFSLPQQSFSCALQGMLLQKLCFKWRWEKLTSDTRYFEPLHHFVAFLPTCAGAYLEFQSSCVKVFVPRQPYQATATTRNDHQTSQNMNACCNNSGACNTIWALTFVNCRVIPHSYSLRSGKRRMWVYAWSDHIVADLETVMCRRILAKLPIHHGAGLAQAV